MAVRKPLYIDPADGDVDEMSPTADTFAVSGITINGTPSASTDAATVGYVTAHAGSGGGTSAKTVELIGPTTGSASEISTTFSDASVTSSSSIMVTVSSEPATGKDADEYEMDQLWLTAIAGNGSLTIKARGMEGNIAGNYKVAYLLASP